MKDWAMDLAEFSLKAIEQACGDWRRAESQRPTIADIRKLAEAAQARINAQARVLPAPGSLFPSKVHFEYLRSLIRLPNKDDKNANGIGFSALTDQQKREWIAYDCAWRLVRLGDSNSPLDKEGQWRDEWMVEQALTMYRRSAPPQLGRLGF